MERKIVRESEEIVLLHDQEDELEEDEEEALSLCDLPNNEEKNQIKKEAYGYSELAQDQDFDFNSCGGNLLRESEMCTADEVFYQGQILPLRHSISLPSGSGDERRIQNLNLISSMSRSKSMEHSHDTNSSSRSSSIRSQLSSSSGSSSTCSNYKPKVRNQFHSHPSPTPQVRLSRIVQTNVNNSSRNKSTMWSLFRVGLVTTPEIALQDLKTRNNKDHSASRNSTSSSSSSLSNDNRMRIILGKKKKQRTFFLGSCKCSANAVETVPSNVLIMNRNSTSKKTRKATAGHEHEDKKATKKQTVSRHRTFEWLKQLSLEGPADET